MKYLDSNLDLNSNKLIEFIDDVPFWSAPFGLQLLEHIIIRKNIVALDIGFGAGFPLTEIAMRLGESSVVYGIDPWEAARKRAVEKLNVYGISNVKILDGVAEDIPLKDKSVDLITSNNGLNNVSNLEKSLHECSRIIKTGGQFIQAVNLSSSMVEFYSIMGEVLTDLNMDLALCEMHEQIYQKRRPLDEITELLKNNNFQVDNVIKDQFNYKFADGTSLLNYYFIRLAFLDSWKSLVPKNLHVEVFSRIENKMNAIAEERGHFKISIPFAIIDSTKV